MNLMKHTLVFACVVVVACGDDTVALDGGADDVAPPDTNVVSEDVGQPDASTEVCPTHLQFVNVRAETHNDLGWTGFGHGLRQNDGSIFTVEVTGCDEDCRRCTVSGPVSNLGVDNRRCLEDSRIICSADSDCGDGGRCRYVQGPPLALNILGRAQCLHLYFDPDEEGTSVEGSVNLETGAVSFTKFIVRVTDNVSAGVCSQCVGDPTLNDGVAGGQCANGVDGLPTDLLGELGQPCDANGFGSALSGTYSYDCPMVEVQPGQDFDVPGISTAGVRWTLDATRPLCTNPAVPEGLPCWCGVCEDGVTPCHSDGECATGSCGFWGGPESGQVPTAPNTCEGECEWDPETSRGSCMSTAAPVRVGCFPAAPGSVIEARGSAEVRGEEYFVTLAQFACLPPSGTDVSNSNLGYPGPALYSQQYRVIPEFRTE